MKKPTPPITLEEARALQPQLVQVRRQIHRHPELGFDLPLTSALVTAELQAMGITVQGGAGRGGVVGLIEGRRASPVVALRAEMDALPIQEQKIGDYASQVEGVSHTCGHDLHTACLLGAARLLAERRPTLDGTVKLLFQPAEEIDQGAGEMIAAGALDNPRVDVLFALHNYPGLPTGSVAVKPGPLMAALDNFQVRIQGLGGHAGTPDKAYDALLAAASVILQLNTIVGRNINPLDPVALNIGTLRAGVAENVVAGEAEFRGTVRTLDPATRARMRPLVRRVVEDGCRALGTRAVLDYQEVLPGVVNDEMAAATVKRAALQLLGAEAVLPAPTTMGGEDFALYLERIPGCLFWLGATEPSFPAIGWHNPKFDLDENAIPIGSAVLAQAALETFNPTAGGNA